MNSARVVLSQHRQKLLSNLHEKALLKTRDQQLEKRYKIKIRRENLNYLQVEVSLKGEKIDEIIKQVAVAKSQYESDLSKVVHVREKWCAIQNELHTKSEVLNEVRGANEEHLEYLCELWQRKKQLRKENSELEKECRLIDNKPLLRKYDRVVEEIEQINNCKKKFEEL
ncbi:rho-associated protein kinase 2-like [Ochlerotatus camptorhynchus]|uniref:rho-associated protein kinase 2-like n=1 Tax=Ochlerotatus camptorhynchus TaxID=644619 RepID=UPI0031D9467C